MHHNHRGVVPLVVLVLRGVLLLEAIDGTFISSRDIPDGMPAIGRGGTAVLSPPVASGGTGGFTCAAVAFSVGVVRDVDEEEADGLLSGVLAVGGSGSPQPNTPADRVVRTTS